MAAGRLVMAVMLGNERSGLPEGERHDRHRSVAGSVGVGPTGLTTTWTSPRDSGANRAKASSLRSISLRGPAHQSESVTMTLRPLALTTTTRPRQSPVRRAGPAAAT
jgi:hypothetical protein